uniref:AH domain-containing protein n=1 Tax=Timema douglasi TaxID=61478 RepID=A0A7R8Z573_TIMDO|nr:unnamed protein product [Timema douglasi]
MNACSHTSDAYSGTAYDRWVEQRGIDAPNKSTIAKMQHHYWVTKQTVFRKLGKKDDECVVASDAELDAKLELFRSIQDSCLDLQRIIDKYQERLCNLAQEENAMGRFLKEAGRTDKTRAGKMMTAVGKSLSYSGQQRLTLRVPLLRLYQEVETFRFRAISDTLQNVTSMEKVRTEYRASLSWMKNVSQELDPDTYKQLERFRKVQGQVRRSKAHFDKLKLDCLQKVDLLAAARCNMFSHALILYQNSLLQFAEKACKTFNTVASNFKGYQHYEFSVVKELIEPSLKLSEQVNNPDETQKCQEETEDDNKDKLLFFDAEFHDEPPNTNDVEPQSQSMENLPPSDLNEEVLLDFELSTVPTLTATLDTTGLDLLTSSDDNFLLLDEILNGPPQSSNLGNQWDAVFGGDQTEESSFLPSQILDQFASLHTYESKPDNWETVQQSEAVGGGSLQWTEEKHVAAPVQKASTSSREINKGQDKKSTWLNLFADLDPLADPDALDRKAGHTDRNC